MSSVDRVPVRAPLYVRALKLRRLRIGGFVSFLLFECMIAVGVLLALAEFASWWAVAVLPAAVALMVKVNDLAMGGGRPRRPARLGGGRLPAGRHVGARRAEPGGEAAATGARLEPARLEPAHTAAGRSGAPSQATGRRTERTGDDGGHRHAAAALADADEPRRPIGTIRISVPARDAGPGRAAMMSAGTVTAHAAGRHARDAGVDDAGPRERRGDGRWLREDSGHRWDTGQNQGRFA
jgi:hypothetical protein